MQQFYQQTPYGYNQHGQPTDMYGNRPQTPYRDIPPYQNQQQMQSEHQWQLAPQIPHQNKNNGTLFRDLQSIDNINEIGNKEVMSEGVLYFFNKETGELFKKEYDYILGRMTIESAKFQKAPETPVFEPQADPRVDELLKVVESLKKPEPKQEFLDPRVDELLSTIEELRKQIKDLEEMVLDVSTAE